ncbi:MAG: outer membrane beta-barrel protein [Bacteroidales bacterium]|nr:outer membrane beta-barrel protein [Bacteroidales bacterium]
MKKILVICLLSGISVFGFSQKLKLGVCLNPHFDWFNENSSVMKSAGSKAGISGGLVIENYFTKNYAFITGIQLGSFGGNMAYDDTITLQTEDNNVRVPAGVDVKYKLQYVSIPVGLKLKTNQIGFFSYYANLGFMPQVNIRARADASSHADNASVGKEIGVFNASYFFGGGIEYGIGGNAAIVVGVTYNNGFVDILSKQNLKQNLNFLTINLGVMF